ncbi:dipeptidase [Amycolatopsis endophytica]|uniref:Membrane dipeptidase n=1 Tax=Amycolatopsis endophytica TaxID=860233 RepID=A0A853B7H9_9PSEU|nr:membrane dipeptidase [Amycolatopsis endophytica]NYI90755.1 membrane dipeptidase [Amycolatopsis endophytica]
MSLHQDAVVVDCHNDLILLVDHFDQRDRPGHFKDFWLPELRAGGVDVQILPICLEPAFQSEGGLRRTLLLVERIHRLAAEHSEDVAVCLTGGEIDAAVAAGKIALVIALEGAHGIGQDVALVRTLHRVGVRVVSMAHFGRTFLADGSGLDTTSRSRLTPQGIEALREMEELGIVFDISHLGLGGVDHVLELATRPFLATHSACLGITDVHRNLHDDHIRQIARLGGVIGVAAAIPFFIDARHPTADRVVDHIERIAEVAGIDHVGLGPDFIDDYYQQVFGGWIIPPDLVTTAGHAEVARPSDLPRITEALVRRGFAESDIRKVLGENVLRVLRDVMTAPAGGSRG